MIGQHPRSKQTSDAATEYTGRLEHDGTTGGRPGSDQFVEE
jgi:hypothetical protein